MGPSCGPWLQGRGEAASISKASIATGTVRLPDAADSDPGSRTIPPIHAPCVSPSKAAPGQEDEISLVQQAGHIPFSPRVHPFPLLPRVLSLVSLVHLREKGRGRNGLRPLRSGKLQAARMGDASVRDLGAEPPAYAEGRAQTLSFGGVRLRPGVVVSLFLVVTFACAGSGIDNDESRVLDPVIAFASDRDRADFNLDLYASNADGSVVRRLTSGRDVSSLGWSPDGSRLVFAAGTRGDIFVMRSDGTQVMNLTKTREESEYEPHWAPDGSRILFFRESIANRQGNVTNVNRTVHVMNADGSGVRGLDLGEVRGATVHPGLEWSPDSAGFALVNRVILRSGVETSSQTDIYTAAGDGGGLRNLTNNPANDDSPAWSPDGTLIAFTSERDGNSEVYVMSRDGTGARRVTQNLGRDDSPSWSPDGRIAFVNRWSAQDRAGMISVVNADGSAATQVTADASCCLISWSPDGKRIAFTSEREGNPEIYVVNSDGTGLENLTKHPSADLSPAWRPPPE